MISKHRPLFEVGDKVVNNEGMKWFKECCAGFMLPYLVISRIDGEDPKGKIYFKDHMGRERWNLASTWNLYTPDFNSIEPQDFT